MLSVQCVVYPFSEFAADAIDLCQVVDTGRHQTLQAAKTCQKTLPSFCADTADFFQCRRFARLAPSCAVPLNGKAMGLIAYLLDQMQSRMFGRQL